MIGGTQITQTFKELWICTLCRSKCELTWGRQRWLGVCFHLVDEVYVIIDEAKARAVSQAKERRVVPLGGDDLNLDLERLVSV